MHQGERSEGKCLKFVYVAVFTSNIIYLAAGMAITWSSPVLEKLKDKNHIKENPLGRIVSPNEESWIGSLLALGAAFGPFISGYLAEKIGRKNTMLLIAIPFIVSFFILAYASMIYFYYFARFLLGLGVGSVFTVFPMYVGEVSEDHNRGMLSSSLIVFLTLGLLGSYIIGPFLPLFWLNIFCAILAIIFMVFFLLFIPDSPYYLVSAGKIQRAEKALQKLRSKSDDIQKEIDIIKLDVKDHSSFHVKNMCNNKASCKAIFISLSLMLFQQFSGINVIMFYAQSIFAAATNTIPAEYSPIIIGIVQFVASFITPIFSDKLGRKLLLIISAIGMMVSQAVLGLYFYLVHDESMAIEIIFWLPILCVTGYITFYISGFGPIPWALMSEIFPSNVKSFAAALTSSFSWLLAFLITRFFGTVVKMIGMSGTFWLFAGFCFLAFIFVWIFVPETKGKSFQEIFDILNS